MSDIVEIRVEGADELRRNFELLEAAISVKRARRELAGVPVRALKLTWVEQARARARVLSDSVPLWRRKTWPTDPVHVAQAIRAQYRRPDGGSEVAAVAGVPRTHFWALFLEFGTRHSAAFPFLRPAWDPEVSLEAVYADFKTRFQKVFGRLKKPKA